MEESTSMIDDAETLLSERLSLDQHKQIREQKMKADEERRVGVMISIVC